MLLPRRQLIKGGAALAAAAVLPEWLPDGNSGPQTFSWSDMTVGAGGNILGFDIVNDGSQTTMVCNTDAYGCYVFNNSTSKWEQLRSADRMPAGDVTAMNCGGTTGGYEIRVAPSNANIIYMVTGGGVVDGSLVLLQKH